MDFFNLPLNKGLGFDNYWIFSNLPQNKRGQKTWRSWSVHLSRCEGNLKVGVRWRVKHPTITLKKFYCFFYICIWVVYQSWSIHSWIVCCFLLRNLTSLSLNFMFCLSESISISPLEEFGANFLVITTCYWEFEIGSMRDQSIINEQFYLSILSIYLPKWLGKL